MNRSNNNSGGFTMIELMLAMTFIAMLLLAVAMTTIQVSHIYDKGITLREVNQAGRAVTDQLQQDINGSTPFDVSSAYITTGGGGRLCLGQYTYVWNYGKAIANRTATNKYKDGSLVRFARVNDQSGALCATPGMEVDKAQATELLTGSTQGGGDRDLAIQIFDINEQTDPTAPNQALYVVKLTIGTNNQAQLMSDNTSCQPPSNGVGDEDYCSVNEFTVVAQAGNHQSEGDN